MSTPRQATLLLAALLFVIPTPAQVVNDGETNVISGGVSNVNGDVVVGTNAPGTLLILTNSALLTNTGNAIIGLSTGADSNSVIVTGPLTRWQLGGDLYVGSNGSFNTLEITDSGDSGNGGQVRNSDTIIGAAAEATGNRAIVTGPTARWFMSGNMFVGSNGSGNSLWVSNGARVFSSVGYLGFDGSSSNNQVVVTGSGSTWQPSYLYVGYAGSGNKMFLTDGASLSNGAVIGSTSSASNNVMVVSGLGTSSKGSIAIGLSGSANTLQISNGAYVSGFGGTVGASATANGNSVLVTGPSSEWTNNGTLTIGQAGSDNSIHIVNGGKVFSRGGVIGLADTGVNNLAVVDGPTSIWRITNSLNVGGNGSSNSLIVQNGGAVMVSGGVFLGSNVISGHNSIAVSGGLMESVGLGLGAGIGSHGNSVKLENGSSWNLGGGALVWGTAGSGNTLMIDAASSMRGVGGLVLDENDTAFFLTNAPGGYSLNGWTTDQLGFTGQPLTTFVVGDHGESTRLLIDDYRLTTSSGVIGGYGSDNTLWLSGQGTIWSNIGDTFIGRDSSVTSGTGAGNALVISNGASAFGRHASLGNGVSANSNLAIITDPGSKWILSHNLTIGASGTENILLISNAASVFCLNSTLGDTTSAYSNMAIISGSNSSWTIGSNLTVGSPINAGNKLLIQQGGVLLSSTATLGDRSDRNLAVVADAGSHWNNSGDLLIGYQSDLNTLIVSNGGFLDVGGQISIVGLSNSVIISGGAVSSGNLELYGTSNRITLENGAVWDMGGGMLDWYAVENFTPLAIDATSSLKNIGSLSLNQFNGKFYLTNGAAGLSLNGWTTNQFGLNKDNFNSLSVGEGGHNVTLVIHDYVLKGTSGTVGGTGSNNTVLVTGPGTLWSNTSTVTVGEGSSSGLPLGKHNALVISNGANVVNTVGTIGALNTAAGNSVRVVGDGSAWINRSNLLVGSTGPSNSLVILDGGLVSAPTVIMGRSTNSVRNRITIDGGTLLVTNNSGTGILDLRRGTNDFYSGLIEVDRLRLTNTSGGFNFHGGTVRVANITNNNGKLFRVGDGTNAANLVLVGNSTHGFVRGLHISSNATVTGNGTLLGNVTNFGVIAAGHSVGAITIHGDLRLRDSASMVFEIGGLIPTNQYDVVTVTNFVEFAGTLSLSLLPGFLPEAADSFALMSFGSSSGSFANVSGGRVSLTNNLASFAVTLSATNLVLSGAQYADSDGDGQGDLQEQAAGTDAADPASALAILSVTLNGTGHSVVRFQSVTGKSYRMEYSDNFATWNVATGAVFTNPLPSVSEWVDDGTLTGGLPANGRAYRIGLQ
jgi:fibronectin-binding autotransporter adhesin